MLGLIARVWGSDENIGWKWWVTERLGRLYYKVMGWAGGKDKGRGGGRPYKGNYKID